MKEARMNYLLQPKKYRSLMSDEGSKAIMDKTIAFFEKMGKPKIKPKQFAKADRRFVAPA
jgi:hypothetical protein